MGSTDIYIDPTLSFLAILNLFGAVQGVFLTLALLSIKKRHEPGNQLLAALILAISIIVGGAVLLSSNYVFLYPHLSRLHHPFVFLAGPLLYLYIRALTSRERRSDKTDFLHFIPFALCLIYLLPYYFQSRAEKLRFISSEYLQQSLGQWYYVRSAIFIAQFLIYLVLIVLTIVQYSKSLSKPDSPQQKAVLLEVRFFVVASSLLWLGAILRYALDSSSNTNLLVPLGASVLVYALGYLKMRRPVVEPRDEQQPLAKKYEKSTLTPERSERYLQKLLNLMQEEKSFTDGELTIQKLAERLSIPAQHLSQTINERLGQTFSDFINSYRVEEAKKWLLDPAKKHYSVLAISEEVGFNSKSSFNAVFKKFVNMTPSEFRRISTIPATR